MPSSGFLRQVSERREGRGKKMEGEKKYGENGGMVGKKRAMVVVDHTSQSTHAMMWALTNVVNKGDLLTLLQIIPLSANSSQKPSSSSSSSSSSSASCSYDLVSSLGSLCKSCKPGVEVEGIVIQGPKLATVLSQVKKLEVSVLVLGQKAASPFLGCFWKSKSREDELVDKCINRAECWTIGVRKQSKAMGGYLINTRCQKNFWLLA